jgi:predicted RNA binding protein YcfA (HicA-like mRNA interferase family)
LKLPRDWNGADLAKKLERLGFSFVRQRGSHIVVKHNATSETIAIPAHRPLKVGTLNALLKSVEELTSLSRDEVLSALDK